MGMMCAITIKNKITLSVVIKIKDLGWDDALPSDLHAVWVDHLKKIIRLQMFLF